MEEDEIVRVKRADLIEDRLRVALAEGIINIIVNDLAGLEDMEALLMVTAKRMAEFFQIKGITIYLLETIKTQHFNLTVKVGKPIRNSERLARQSLQKGLFGNSRFLALPIAADNNLGAMVLNLSPKTKNLRIDLVSALARYLATRLLEIHGCQTMVIQLPNSVVVNLPINPKDLKREAKREMATIVFADIRGFTALSEIVQPELLQLFLNKYFTVMEPLVKKHDGTIVKFLADGILAVFGTPQKCPNHTQMAIRCAWEMLKEFKKVQQVLPQHGLTLGIGIDRGIVMSGYFGSLGRITFDIIGDSVNTASRIQGTAHNSIHLSASAYRAVKNSIKAEALVPVFLKGKERSQRLYVVKSLLG